MSIFYDKVVGKISLGLCCINTKLREQKPPVFCSRTLTRANFSVDKAKEKALQNVKDIYKMIEWNRDNDIRLFRLSSDIYPHFTDKETEPYSIDFSTPLLKQAGDLANKLGHRIVMHPGQYNNVGAISRDVFESTVKDLSHHADILDAMGIGKEGVLIVHGGGTYGKKQETMERWVSQFRNLPQKVQDRLVIENCERQYSTRDCLNISSRTGIPVVFDFHHYECWNKINGSQESIMDMAEEIVKSWKGVTPLMHISEQGAGKIGHHSDFIEKLPNELFYIIQEYNTPIDLEVEAKMKEQAIDRIRKKYTWLFGGEDSSDDDSSDDDSSDDESSDEDE